MMGKTNLIVRVEDDTEAQQLRGKQVLNPEGIWYTQVTGIWQTVWTEEVAERSIEDLKIATSATDGSITITPVVTGGRMPTEGFKVEIRDGDAVAATLDGRADSFKHTFAAPKLWSPTSPHLYQISLSLVNARGEVVDMVKSYAGIRTVGKMRDASGNYRLTLNGQPIFHFGPLDQGWWPDGLLTPPSDAAMIYDIDFLKSAGFNMIRKHIKVEPRRYYYHCDQVGMLVWQDQVSGGNFAPWTQMKPDPKDAIWADEDHAQYKLEFERMVSNLENHPSIVVWTPFNEAWGQHRTVEVGNWIKQRDPSRTINIASGGNFWPVGDIADAHNYPHPDFPFQGGRFNDYVKVVGEFGGHGYRVESHLWKESKANWGYGGLPKDEAEYIDRYRESIRRLHELRDKGISAGVYTQTTDVEGEINGLMSYDREVIKIPVEQLREMHMPLYGSEPAPAAAAPAVSAAP